MRPCTQASPPVAGVTAFIALAALLLFQRFAVILWWSAIGIGLVTGALMGCTLGSRSLAQVPGIFFRAGTGAVSTLGFWLTCLRDGQLTQLRTECY